MVLADLLKENGNDFSNQDLAALADWANAKKYSASDPDWKRAYGLIREGSDLLLRRRVRLNGDNSTGSEHGTQMGDGRVRFPVTQPTTTKG
jgi:hypothetical protein